MPELLGLLDGARRAVLRRVLRLRPLRHVFIDRGRRVAAGGALASASAAGLALLAPVLSLWAGAAILGVPHVVSGVRFVAIRSPLTRLARGCVLLAAALGVLAIAGVEASRTLTGLFAAAMLAEVVAARPAPLRGALLLLSIAAFFALGCAAPILFFVGLTHAHALSSIAYFALRARARAVPAWPLLSLSGLFCLAVAAGAFDALLAAAPWAPGALAQVRAVESAAAALPDASAAAVRRALCLYAFGQALHYTLWLRLLPEVERDRPVPHSFRRAHFYLRQDLGPWLLPALLLCALAAPLLLAGGAQAREAYFALIYFHIGLEAAGLVRLLARPAAPAPASARRAAPAPTCAGTR